VMWTIFDYPCGARLASILKTETERMRTLKELVCSDEVAQKLRFFTEVCSSGRG